MTLHDTIHASSGHCPAVVEQNGPFAVNYSILPSVTVLIFGKAGKAGKAHGSQGFETCLDPIFIWLNQ
jgi:hypothetical protein